MDWIYKVTHKCRLCSSQNMETIVDFGNVNLYTANTGIAISKGDPNLFITAPLTLALCKSCSNMQLGEIVNPEFLYKNFQYKTQVTSGLKEHFELLANTIIDVLKIKQGDAVLDIGSNDGTFLSNFKARAKIVGVEPGKKVATYANKRGINTINAYFNEDLGSKIREDYGLFRVIFCANTIANIEDLNEIFDVSKSLLAKNGYFIVETQNGADVIEHFLLDTVYHEHLNYFTFPSFKDFAKKRGFRVAHVSHHKQKGGSLQIWFTHDTNLAKLKLENNHQNLLKKAFARLNLNNPILVKNTLDKKIKKVRESLAILNRNSLYGFGASVGTNTLMHLFCKNLKIKQIYDDNPTIKSLPFGNVLLPVIQGKEITSLVGKARIIVFAYRYYEKILKNHKKIENRFINIFEVLKK